MGSNQKIFHVIEKEEKEFSWWLRWLLRVSLSKWKTIGALVIWDNYMMFRRFILTVGSATDGHPPPARRVLHFTVRLDLDLLSCFALSCFTKEIGLTTVDGLRPWFVDSVTCKCTQIGKCTHAHTHTLWMAHWKTHINLPSLKLWLPWHSSSLLLSVLLFTWPLVLL